MFVFSLRASKIKYLFSALICAVVATFVILIMPDTEHSVTVNGNVSEYEAGKIRFDGIKNLDGVISFAESLGFSVDRSSVETAEVKIPSKTDAVLEEYNNLQKSQGFNLMKYKNKTAVRYTFKVTGLPDEQSLPEDDVLLTVILCKDKVIGGDLYFTGKNERVKGILK